MLSAQITAIEYYLPDHVVDNDELSARFPEWTAAAIETKTGIRRRHVTAADETAADLAVAAAQRLFAAGKLGPQEVDFLILCTQSPDYPLPTTACLIQDRLGLPRSIGALDVNQGCSGFVYGLALSSGLIAAGLARTVLLLTAETYTKWIHARDKALHAIFGDGAAATVVRGVPAEPGAPAWLGPFVFGTDGGGARHLIVKAGGARLPRGPGVAAGDDPAALDACLHMDGPAIFSFTLSAIPPLVKQLYEQGGIQAGDVDLFVFHQANGFMLEALRKGLGIPRERFVMEFGEIGNTVSSTIPIALAEHSAKHGLASGTRAMLVGFGVGLSWAGALVTLPGNL